MQMFYITLFFVGKTANDAPKRPEFHIEGETFEHAAIAALDWIRSEHPNDEEYANYIGPMGWPVPGVKVAKRIS